MPTPEERPSGETPEERPSGESLLDALDLDPRLSLTELAEALRDIASGGDPVLAERARRTFEALTARPEAHFSALLEAVPRRQAAPRPRPPERVPFQLTVANLLPPPSLEDCMGPPTPEEVRLMALLGGNS